MCICDRRHSDNDGGDDNDERVASRRVALHCIASHRLTSHRIASLRIGAFNTASYAYCTPPYEAQNGHVLTDMRARVHIPLRRIPSTSLHTLLGVAQVRLRSSTLRIGSLEIVTRRDALYIQA